MTRACRDCKHCDLSQVPSKNAMCTLGRGDLTARLQVRVDESCANWIPWMPTGMGPEYEHGYAQGRLDEREEAARR